MNILIPKIRALQTVPQTQNCDFSNDFDYISLMQTVSVPKPAHVYTDSTSKRPLYMELCAISPRRFFFHYSRVGLPTVGGEVGVRVPLQTRILFSPSRADPFGTYPAYPTGIEGSFSGSKRAGDI